MSVTDIRDGNNLIEITLDAQQCGYLKRIMEWRKLTARVLQPLLNVRRRAAPRRANRSLTHPFHGQIRERSYCQLITEPSRGFVTLICITKQELR